MLLVRNTSPSMMLHFLILKDQEKPEVKVSLDRDNMVLGMGEEGFFFNEAFYDEKCLEFSCENGQWFVERLKKDFEVQLCGSSLGGGKKSLSKGDILQMGESILEYQTFIPEEEEAAVAAEGAEGKTQFMEVVSVADVQSKGHLVGISGSIKGQVFEFSKDKISVGRDVSNDIPISKDGLSRAHAVIEVGDGEITIMDFGSTNGTFVDGKKITSATIEPGQIVQFANAALRYEIPGFVPEGQGFGWGRLIMILVLVSSVIGLGALWYIKSNEKKQNEVLDAKKKEIEILAKKMELEKSKGPQKAYGVALKAFEEKQYEEAFNVVSAILNKFPDYPEGLVLKGKIEKAMKENEMAQNFKKGSELFIANRFDQAEEVLRKIDPMFGRYRDVRAILDQLDLVANAKSYFEQSQKDFYSGDLEKASQAIAQSLKDVPVLKESIALDKQIKEVKELLTMIRKAEEESDSEGLDKGLKDLMALVPDRDNYFHQFASKKHRAMISGKYIRAEVSYAKGIEALATGKFAQAFEALKKASLASGDLVKIKIALSEAKKRREVMLNLLAQNAELFEKEKNSVKAKVLWREIVSYGEDSNSFYDRALKRLQS